MAKSTGTPMMEVCSGEERLLKWLWNNRGF